MGPTTPVMSSVPSIVPLLPAMGKRVVVGLSVQRPQYAAAVSGEQVISTISGTHSVLRTTS
jgi:hypothetical protein